MTGFPPGAARSPVDDAPAEQVAIRAIGGLFPSPFRAESSHELLAEVTSAYELDWTGESADLGGEMNLNLALSGTNGPAYVLRVYTPWVSAERVRFIQALRSHLRHTGLPFTETLATRPGQGVVDVHGRVAEIEHYVTGTNTTWDRRRLRPALAMLGRIHAAAARADGLATSTHPDMRTMWKPNERSAGPGEPRHS